MLPEPVVMVMSLLHGAGLEASSSVSDALWWLAGLELPGGILSTGKPGSTGESQPPECISCAPWQPPSDADGHIDDLGPLIP